LGRIFYFKEFRLLRLIFALLLTAHAGWWSNWCARHLVADDPYQFEDYDVDSLVTAYFSGRPSPVLIREMERRLERELSFEEREMIVKALANKQRE
jgi:hypothetical protein